MKFLNGLVPTFDLTYDDVFMVPSRSAVGSRMGVDLASDDATGTTIPLVVANMTAVAGKRMAETVARRGAMAIVPQDIPVDVVIDTVSQVKASHRFYDTPVTVKPHHTCGYALGLIPKRSHGAAVVVDAGTGVPVGLVDTSDVSGVDRFTQVREVMSTELLTLPEGIESREAFARLRAARRRLAPVVDDGGRLVGLLTRDGAVRSTIYAPALDAAGRLRVGAAIGLNGDPAGRAYKESFGMASKRAVTHRTEGEDAFDRARKALFEEGISAGRMYLDPARPGVEDLIDSIVAGVRSAFTYAGAGSVPEFRERAVVGIQSASGYREGAPVPVSW